jgi:hypothetical protein
VENLPRVRVRTRRGAQAALHARAVRAAQAEEGGVIADVLEIETTTILRGPLAESLVKLAEECGRTPVDQMADIVEWALKGEFQPESTIENEASPASVTDYLPAVNDALVAEARRRRVSIGRLVRDVVTAVARDNLFSAVLDSQGD